jgi:phosphoglycerate dehydrogenase-like enzyme
MNFLITGAWQEATNYIPILKEQGHPVHFLKREMDALPCSPVWVEGIIGNGIFHYHHIEAFTNLRYIQLTSAGFDRIPMDYINEHGIIIKNARGVYSVPMAELAIAGVLQIFKEMTGFYENQKKHLWKKNRKLRELAGQTVAIIGCGSVGTECAKRFKAFETTIIGVNDVVKENEHYDRITDIGQLDQVLGLSDIVVVTVPLTDKTNGLINAAQINKMKRNALLVNLARGAVVVTKDLIAALNKNIIGGAVLDVFENEPLDENSPLWDMHNVIITPHNSFVGNNNNRRMSCLIMKNLCSLS